MFPRPHVGHVVLQRPEHEGPEPAPVAVRQAKPIASQKMGEEALHQILRIRLALPAAANKSEQGPPVDPEQLPEGLPGLLVPATRRIPHKRPAGGVKQGLVLA